MIKLISIANYIFFFTLFIFLVACANHEKQYYYAHYYKGDSIPDEYQRFNISYQDEFRIDSIFYSKTIDGIYEFDRIRKYLVRDGRMYRVNLKDSKKLTSYLSTLDTVCVESPGIKLQETEVITVCFLDKENIVIDGKEFKNVYKFKRTYGFDGITTIDYYDSDLILLKEEHIYGYTAPYYKIRIEYK